MGGSKETRAGSSAVGDCNRCLVHTVESDEDSGGVDEARMNQEAGELDASAAALLRAMSRTIGREQDRTNRGLRSLKQKVSQIEADLETFKED